MLLQLGAIYKRFYLALDVWPWRLGRLLDPSLSIQEKRSIAQQLVDASPCCLDPFTAGIKMKAPSVGALLAPAFLQDLRDIFEHIPITNVNTENRFAAMNTRSLASHGNVVCGRTLASDHVLMEGKLVLDVGLACKP